MALMELPEDFEGFEEPSTPQPGIGLDEVQSLLKAQIDEAVNYAEEELAAIRSLERRYYEGENMPGDEDLDNTRSKVISRDVHDTVKAILPNLLRIFFSGKSVVEFEPIGPEDEPFAAQATQYVNNIVLRKDNPGFRIFYDVFWDALAQGLGTIMWYWEDEYCVEGQEYRGISEQDYQMLIADPQVIETDVLRTYEPPEMPGVILYDCDISYRKVTGGKTKVEAVPPEERLINKRARDIDDSTIYGRRRVMMVSDIVAMGYDYDQVVEMGGDEELDTNEEATERYDSLVFDSEGDSTDPAQRLVAYYDIYMKADVDGDGYAELYHFAAGGTNAEILIKQDGELAMELANEIPYAEFCPDPIPHLATGNSTADSVMDVQRVKTNLLRAMLDSLSRSIFPDSEVVQNQVNMQDMLNPEIGKIIRTKAPGMIREVTTTFMGKEALPVLGYMDDLKTNRTGLTSVSQGLDPQALQSTTASAVTAVTESAQVQIEMIARIFAQDGMSRAFRGILKLIKTHQDMPRTVRLTNSWVPVDPTYWNASMDAVVNTALGKGREAEKTSVLMALAEKQEMILEKLGPMNPICTLAEYRNTLGEITRLQGFPNDEKFWLPVDQQKVMQQFQQQMQQMQQELQQAQQQLEIASFELRGHTAAEDAKDHADALKKRADAMKTVIEAMKTAGEQTVPPNAAEDEMTVGARYL